jgi:TrmH family RNA methyltransferase
MSLSRNKERLLARLKGGRSRAREGLFVVEGVRGSEEALQHGVEVRFGLCSPRLQHTDRGLRLARRLEREVGELLWVDDITLEAVSHTDAPQGVLLVCGEPPHSLDQLDEASGSGSSATGPLHLLVLDGVQDPGNLGTLSRAAAAFGLHGVVALTGTVDPWNSKAVRSSAGACFAIPVVRSEVEEFLEWCASRRIPLLLGEMDGAPVESRSGVPWALVIGSEADGPSAAVRGAAEFRISVPMAGPVESLNAAVAGGILMFALTRGRETN